MTIGILAQKIDEFAGVCATDPTATCSLFVGPTPSSWALKSKREIIIPPNANEPTHRTQKLLGRGDDCVCMVLSRSSFFFFYAFE